MTTPEMLHPDWTLPALLLFWTAVVFSASAMVLAEPAWLTQQGSRAAHHALDHGRPAATAGARGSLYAI